jgi:hypothetical protein
MDMDQDELRGLLALILLGIFGSYGVYLFFGNAIALWWNQNWWIFAIIVGGLFVFLCWLFFPSGKTISAAPPPPPPTYHLTPSLVYEIVDLLEKWVPSKVFRDEGQAEVAALEYLRHFYPAVAYQQQHSNFRADLEIEDVGIEIKLPKRSRHLMTLRGQMMQYCNYFEHVIALIFSYHDTLRDALESFVDDMEKQYGDKVKVIVKEID